MATNILVPNRILGRLKLALAVAALAILGIPLAMAGGFVLMATTLLVVATATILFIRSARAVRWRSGASGEIRARAVLAAIPNAVVLNEVRIPRTAGRPFEADYLVISPTRAVLVEVKNNAGEIRPSNGNAAWTARRGGYDYVMRNPVRQVQAQAARLGGLLREHGARVWLDTVVCFTNPDVELPLSKDVPLLTPGQLGTYFASPPARPQHLDPLALARLADQLSLSAGGQVRSWKSVVMLEGLRF